MMSRKRFIQGIFFTEIKSSRTPYDVDTDKVEKYNYIVSIMIRR